MPVAAPAAAPQIMPGSLYGVPGMTLLTEQIDNNAGVVQAVAQGNSSQVSGITEFKQTDVVYWWEIEVAWTNTVTAGTSVITPSPYFPFSVLGESRLQIQNMYSTWHPMSGIDAYIWQLIRPMRQSDKYNLGVDTPLNQLTADQLTTAPNSVQANLNGTLGIASTSTAIVFTLDVPASVFFDVYYDLAVDGTVVSNPHRALVSPQYMAGAARVIQPQLGVNPGFAATLDNGPFNAGAGTGTYAGSLALNFRRIGVYSANNPGPLPVVYNWQYLREATNFSLSGVSRKDLNVPTYGQIMSVFLRLFDPSAAAGKGAPISLSTLTKAQLQFGSGLLRYDDTPKSAQRRFVRQHGVLLPEGVLVWDLAMDEFGRVSNGQLLNTLTTAGVLAHLEFTGALSATAYCVMGVEALTYVA